MSAASKRHLARVHEIPCVLCRHLGFEETPAAAHHIRDGNGMAQRASDWLSVALCHEHHQGDSGFHGMGKMAFQAQYKLTELDLLAMTLERIYG